MKAVGQMDHDKKVYHITLDGFASPEQREEIGKAFQEAVASINPTEYSLVFDCRKLATFKPELLPILESYYQFYMKMGFKKVIIIKPQHTPSAMQIQRVAKNVNFFPVFIQTVEEINYYLAS